MAEVKGVLLNAVLAFFKKRFGAQEVEAAIASLSPGDRMNLPSVILDSSWYSYSAWGSVRRMSAVLSNERSPAFAIEMGKFNADYVFTGVYKSLLINDPVKLVKKFSWLHDFFYRDGLALETEIPNPNCCYVRYRYQEGARPARSTCASTMGFWIRTIELAGGTNVRARHTKCRAEGKDICEYQMEWA